MLIKFLVLGLCTLQQFGAKAELSIIFDDLTITAIDPEYLDPVKTVAYIVEDSLGGSITSNLTVLKLMPAGTEARLKLLGLSMGQYKISTGVDVKMKLCDMLDEPIILGPFFSVLGFTSDNCPPSAGTYGQEGYHLPTEALPDDFPENKYLAIFEILFNGKPLIGVKVFTDVTIE